MAESKDDGERLTSKEKFNRRLDRRERLRRRKRDMTRVRYVGRGINPAQVRRLRALKRDSDPRNDDFFQNVVDTGPEFVIGRKYKHDYDSGFSYEEVRTTPKLERTIRDLLTPKSPIPELEGSIEEKSGRDLHTPSPRMNSPPPIQRVQSILGSPSDQPPPPQARPALPLQPLGDGEREDSELASSPSGRTPERTKETPDYRYETPGQSRGERKFQSVIL